jgi:hypothetical protein
MTPSTDTNSVAITFLTETYFVRSFISLPCVSAIFAPVRPPATVMSAALPWTGASSSHSNKIYALLRWVFMTVGFDGMARLGGRTSTKRWIRGVESLVPGS